MRILISFLVLLCVTTLTTATTFSVNSGADTTIVGDGECTLREAVIAASFDSTNIDCGSGSSMEEDVIQFDWSVLGGMFNLQFINLGSALQVSGGSLTIDGSGGQLSIIGTDFANVFTVDQSANTAFRLINLAVNRSSGDFGRGIVVSGSTSIVELTGVAVLNHFTTGRGAGLYINTDTVRFLSILDGRFTDNDASLGGGAIGFGNGTITADLNWTIDGTQFLRNHASDEPDSFGGALAATVASIAGLDFSLLIQDAIFQDNTTFGTGAAVGIATGGAAMSTISVLDSVFRGNCSGSSNCTVPVDTAALPVVLFQGDPAVGSAQGSVEVRRSTFYENVGDGTLEISRLGVDMVNNFFYNNASENGASVRLLMQGDSALRTDTRLLANTVLDPTATEGTPILVRYIPQPAAPGTTLFVQGNLFSGGACFFSLGNGNNITVLNDAYTAGCFGPGVGYERFNSRILSTGDPLHPLRHVPAGNSQSIDSWPESECLDLDQTPLTADLTDASRRPIRGDSRNTEITPACDSGAFENPTGRLLALVRTGNGEGRVTVMVDGTTDSPLSYSGNSSVDVNFVDGDQLTVTGIESDPFSTFVGFSGECSGTASCSVVMDQDRTLEARFDLKPTYQLTVNQADSGSGFDDYETVIGLPVDATCNANQQCSYGIPQGTTIELEAAAFFRTDFAGWSGDCAAVGTNTMCSLTMDSDKSVESSFVYTGIALSVSVVGDGQVTSSVGSIACPGDCEDQFDGTETITLTPVPGTGQAFAGWSGDCSGFTCKVSGSGTVANVTATFIIDPDEDLIFFDDFETQSIMPIP